MLVLTRKQNEKIKIGDNITITVLRMKGKAVRLGIQAPEDMTVLRGEIAFDIEVESLPAENDQENAASGTPAAFTSNSRIAKSQHQFKNSVTWSNDSHPNLIRDEIQRPAKNCQICWSI